MPADAPQGVQLDSADFAHPQESNMSSISALHAGLVFSVLLAASPGHAQAQTPLTPALTIVGGTSATLNPFNDWYAGRSVRLGAQLALSGPATVTYRFLGREAGFDNAFEVNGLTVFRNSDLGTSLASPTDRSFEVKAGVLDFAFRMNDGPVKFLSNGSNSAGSVPGFGILGNDGQRVTLLLDDSGRQFGTSGSIDDDYDDMIVEVSIQTQPVPEPHEWLFMVAGLAAMTGFAKRRRSVRT
jgi:hypothetical protein